MRQNKLQTNQSFQCKKEKKKKKEYKNVLKKECGDKALCNLGVGRLFKL